ncbi:Zinc carboxypeptidase [Thaumarchaeota archaeon SCGC AB-539-E09]|nr:Zinc carboxypeptidase [Thaumarchaeota archaeon SCGC AB-539-E09]
MNLDEILREVPDYKEFLTVDELNVSSVDLVDEYNHIEFFQIGESTEGEPISALKIGEGPRNALLFGFPHPNEPIGSMTLEYLSRRLTEDDSLREEMGYTWYIVKCIDPDGARLNEGWFKGEFAPLKYALNYYRPPGKNQVEWTFPIDYKTLHFHSPLPETQALMRLIDAHKPTFLYSLHNAGFCGVYWYLGEELPPLYSRLHDLVRDQGLPLHMGEPETPFIEKIDDAIFRMFGAEEGYDFTAKHTDEDPAKLRDSGTSSHGYLRRVCDGFTLLCEMPYYFDERVMDGSPSDVDRREAVLEGIRYGEETYEFLNPRFKVMAEKADKSKRLYQSTSDYMENFVKRQKPRRRHAETAEEYKGKATVAQAFDSIVARKFGTMFRLGMTLRVADEILSKGADLKIQRILDEIEEHILQTNKEVEAESDIEVIPIQKLVRIQLGSGLMIMEHLKNR